VSVAVKLAGDKLRSPNAAALAKHDYMAAKVGGFLQDLEEAEGRLDRGGFGFWTAALSPIPSASMTRCSSAWKEIGKGGATPGTAWLCGLLTLTRESMRRDV
jgi:hypothetical protein